MEAGFEEREPTNSRIGSHSRPARVLLKRYRVNAGPSTSTVWRPGALRSSNSATARTMARIQKTTDEDRLEVLARRDPAEPEGSHGASM